MSLLLVIDGYNVVPPIAPPGRSTGQDWLQQERMGLVRRLADHLPKKIADQTCVVFDAANPPRDRAAEFQFQGITVRFAVGYPQADDLIEEIIQQHTSAKRLTVVSSDHRIHVSAKRRGATPFDSEPWFDALLDGRLQLAISRTESGQGRAVEKTKPEPNVSDKDVGSWMKEFGFDD